MANFKFSVGAVLVAAFIWWILYPLDPYLVDPAAVVGKRVLVTGASLGIGKAIAIEYARRNVSHLVLVSRSLGGLNKVRDEILLEKAGSTQPLQIDILSADLSTEEASVEVIEEAVELMGGLDVLVLNHITSTIMDSWMDIETRFAYMAATFNVNTFSYIWMATTALKHLKKSSGQIVVVSSFAGHVGVPKTTIYSAAKHALHGFFDGFRNELIMAGDGNVGITMCAIGSTDTEGASTFKDRIPTVTWHPADGAAVAIVNGGALRRRDVYHPQMLVYPSILIDTLFPSAMDYFIRDSMKSV